MNTPTLGIPVSSLFAALEILILQYFASAENTIINGLLVPGVIVFKVTQLDPLLTEY